MFTFHIRTVFVMSRRYIVMLLFYLYILLECNQTRSIAMLLGTSGIRANCSGIRDMRVRRLLLQVAGTMAAACSRPIRLMGEAWKEQRGVAGRQRAKRHPDVISSSQTASQRTTMAPGIFFGQLLILSQHIELHFRSFSSVLWLLICEKWGEPKIKETDLSSFFRFFLRITFSYLNFNYHKVKCALNIQCWMSALNTVQIMMSTSICCNIRIWLFFTDADPQVTVAHCFPKVTNKSWEWSDVYRTLILTWLADTWNHKAIIQVPTASWSACHAPSLH